MPTDDIVIELDQQWLSADDLADLEAVEEYEEGDHGR